METLYFTKEHLWIRIEDTQKNIVSIGISHYGQESFGELVFVDIMQSKTEYTEGEVLAIIESSKIASDIYYPFHCSLKEVNKTLQEKPTIVNVDPMNEGWLVKVVVDSLEVLQNNCMTKTEYDNFIQEFTLE